MISVSINFDGGLAMTLQEILQAVDELSVDEQTSLMNVLQEKIVAAAQEEQVDMIRGERFWNGILHFREVIEQENIEFTDEDFADLRNRNPGREVEL